MQRNLKTGQVKPTKTEERQVQAGLDLLGMAMAGVNDAAGMEAVQVLRKSWEIATKKPEQPDLFGDDETA